MEDGGGGSASSRASADPGAYKLPPQLLLESVRASATPLTPHHFYRKKYLLPTFCDVCSGVLWGTAYKCEGCGMRCHIGYGVEGREDCRAEALLQPCEGAGRQHAAGFYRFGDISRQKARDAKSRAREVVRQVIVAEQEKLGKLDKLKELVVELRSRCGDEGAVSWLLLKAQFGGLLGLVVATFVLLGLGGAPALGTKRAHSVGVLQAASNACWLLTVEGLLGLGIRFLAVRAALHSVILDSWVREVLRVELAELGNNLDHAAAAAQRVMERFLGVTVVLLSLSAWVWLQAVYAL